MTIDDSDFAMADAMVEQAAAINLAAHCKASFRAGVNEALSQIDTSIAEGKRARDELFDAMVADYHNKAIQFIATGDRAAIDSIYRRMVLDVRERVRIMCVSAEDNPGRPGAGRLHQRGPHEIIKSLVGGGKFLTDRGFNARCVETIEARMEKLAPGVEPVAANFDGSVEFSDGSVMTLEEMYDEARPVSISRESWIEGFPTPEDFDALRIRFEQRQTAEQRNATPWSDNGITSRDGRFRSFRDMQS